MISSPTNTEVQNNILSSQIICHHQCCHSTIIHRCILHPTAVAININETIWDVYFNQLLPLFTTEGDDGNYVPTATSDLQCLQTETGQKIWFFSHLKNQLAGYAKDCRLVQVKPSDFDKAFH
ncbi:hypothetical protein POM88_029621 [Heracleum sosnowskyi]|uniref:chorismate mutase n=1 Tax=Heracleum sosnowskyi TaxID=360622 RepID=A0AAD8MIN4_9APIA|nr:hypothetical protein POM88_029621 [Heracleum sosnowskyi]